MALYFKDLLLCANMLLLTVVKLILKGNWGSSGGLLWL